MKAVKKFVYIREGVIYRGDDAIKAKEEVEANKLVDELKSSLENIAATTSDPITSNNVVEDCNGINEINEIMETLACVTSKHSKKVFLIHRSLL